MQATQGRASLKWSKTHTINQAQRLDNFVLEAEMTAKTKGVQLTDATVATLKSVGVIPEGSTPEEIKYFQEWVDRTQLDPVARQIYLVRRKSTINRQEVWRAQVQVSIDGFRLIADRTEDYAGQDGPYWYDRKTNQWLDVWLEETPPPAAKVGIFRRGFAQPLYAVALWAAYKQETSYGLQGRWKNDPAGMLAKCAESLALRRAFPADLSGIYTTEEMSAVKGGRIPTDPDDDPEPGAATPDQGLKGSPTRAAGPRLDPPRPFSPDDLRDAFARTVATIEAKGLLLGPDDFSITQDALDNLLESEQDLGRFLEYVTGIPYLEDMNESTIVALMRMMKPANTDGAYQPCDEAKVEAAAVIAALNAKQPAAPTITQPDPNQIPVSLMSGEMTITPASDDTDDLTEAPTEPAGLFDTNPFVTEQPVIQTMPEHAPEPPTGWVTPTNDEDWPDPKTVTLDLAMLVTDSEGHLYANNTAERLSYRLTNIQKNGAAAAKAKAPAAKMWRFKFAVVKMLIEAKNAGTIPDKIEG